MIQSSPGQILSGGGLSLRGDDLLNDKSRIIVGRTLQGDLANLENRQAEGTRVVNDVGTVRSSWTYTRRGGKWRTGTKHTRRAFSDPVAYNPGAEVTTIQLNVEGSVNGAASVAGTQSQADASQRDAALMGLNTSATPSIVLPVSSLFTIQPDSGARYLVETDPRFASYRQWLSSDYLLAALAIDPTHVHKRLGDGFYEQRLVREQIAALTGHRFLGDFRDDDQQFESLMTAGATFAQAHQLRPGIALSGAQVAQLTSDIVWLVSESIQLPDGTTTTALVPRVYLAPREGDLAANGDLWGGSGNAAGSLISANEVQLALSGDLENSGTIAGRKLLDLSAQNIDNTGLMQGDVTRLNATENINIVGGQVVAHRGMDIRAGGDLTVATTTQSSATQAGGNAFSQQGIDRVAGLYVTGSEGVLLASAGNDINLLAAQVHNAGSGITQLQAGGDINIGTVDVGQSHNITWGQHNYHHQSSQQEVGTHLTGQGAVLLQAQNDIHVRAAQINAQGALALQAIDGNLTLEAGENTQSLAESQQWTDRGTFSRRTTTHATSQHSSFAQASELGGQTVTLLSGEDTRIIGSNVLADQDLNIHAGGDLLIDAAQNTSASDSVHHTRRSGLFGTGGLGFTLGSQRQSSDAQNQHTTAAASTLGSIGGDVNLSAGQTYTQRGSDVLAPGGDVNISAQTVQIEEAREVEQQGVEHNASQRGLSVSLSNPVLDAGQTIQQQVQAAGNTQSTRMQALAAANVAMNAQHAANTLQQGQGQTDGKAVDKVGGINLNVSLGSSRSQSNQHSSIDTARGSSVTAGGDVNISATGAGEKSNIVIQGSQVQAGGTTRLSAENDVQLLAAINTQEEHNSNRSSSASVGVSMGVGGQATGVNLTASGNRAQGQGSGSGTTYTHTHVSGGQGVQIESGGDTTLQGAVVQGDQVIANVAGDLHIETLQDSTQYNERQRNTGFSASVPIGPGAASGSLNAGRTHIHSNYQSACKLTLKVRHTLASALPTYKPCVSKWRPNS